MNIFIFILGSAPGDVTAFGISRFKILLFFTVGVVVVVVVVAAAEVNQYSSLNWDCTAHTLALTSLYRSRRRIIIKCHLP